jgi:hypothetical protein
MGELKIQNYGVMLKCTYTYTKRDNTTSFVCFSTRLNGLGVHGALSDISKTLRSVSANIEDAVINAPDLTTSQIDSLKVYLRNTN